MFPSREHILSLHLNGHIIPTTADHCCVVVAQCWTEAANLRPGDLLLSHDGQTVPVEGISDSGEQEVVCSRHSREQSMPDQSNHDAGKPIIGCVAGRRS